MEKKIMRILIADDDKSIRTMFARALGNRTMSIDHVGNGIEALQLINTHHYDLVITDYQMPGINGFELTRWIKTNYPAIPVIITSGCIAPEILMKSGAQICLPKPIEIRELRTIVKIILEPVLKIITKHHSK